MMTLATLVAACGTDDGAADPPGDAGLDDDPSSAVVGEVPEDLLAEVLADASTRTGMAVGSIEVLRAQSVQWSDGSLGCPEPGQMYTQAIVPGYWVELRAGDRILDYRLTGQGHFILCPSGSTDGIVDGDGNDDDDDARRIYPLPPDS